MYRYRYSIPGEGLFVVVHVLPANINNYCRQILVYHRNEAFLLATEKSIIIFVHQQQGMQEKGRTLTKSSGKQAKREMPPQSSLCSLSTEVYVSCY